MTGGAPPAERRRFARFAAAGILFQGGAATTDTSTIVATLVHGLTGSPVAAGAAAAISRIGWLAPQIVVAHLAQGRSRRMGFYMFGAFGRAACLLAVAVLLWSAGALSGVVVAAGFFALWTVYAFVSGVVAVPYNDIVARAIPSGRRSRLLAIRFFGGGLLALAVAGLAHRFLETLPVRAGYAAVFAVGAGLLFASALSFVSAGEPDAPAPAGRTGFGRFLRAGVDVLRTDTRFRLFFVAQWFGGMVGMVLPLYVILALHGDALRVADVALLVGAQTAGALLSNPLWGWLGDYRGKLALLRIVAMCGAVAPALALFWTGFGAPQRELVLVWFGLVFLLLGAADNGRTIAYLGYLMEISPDDRRPAYSGYFNLLLAPVWLFPILAAILVEVVSFAPVFALSLVAAALQLATLHRLARHDRARERS